VRADDSPVQVLAAGLNTKKEMTFMSKHIRFVAPLCFSALLAAAVPGFGATVVVGSCVPSKVTFSSITEAVQGAPAGSTIQICPGVYAEQIVISKALTLKGIQSGNGANPVIRPPASGLVTNGYGLAGSSFWALGAPLAAQIVIMGGADVTVTNLALDATGLNIVGCSPVAVGVLVQDASATLSGLAVKNQFNPCVATGVGVGVLSQNDSATASTVTVKNTTFVNSGQAFEADGANNTSTVANSSFAGSQPSNFNAISIVNGSSTIQGNTISNFNYPPAGTDVNSASYGIFLSCVPGGSVVNNHIAGTQLGIYVLNGCTSTAVSITGNEVSDSFVGIDAGGNNGLVQGNDIRTSVTAIRFPGGSTGNTVQNNTINDVCAAFGSNPAAGANAIGNNNVMNAANVTFVSTTPACP
jgi:hypothetical protein